MTLVLCASFNSYNYEKRMFGNHYGKIVEKVITDTKPRQTRLYVRTALGIKPDGSFMVVVTKPLYF